MRPLSCKPFGLQPTVLNTKLKFIDAQSVWVSQFFYKYMKVPIISCCIFGVCSEIQNLVLFGSAFRSKILITCCLLEIISVSYAPGCFNKYKIWFSVRMTFHGFCDTRHNYFLHWEAYICAFVMHFQIKRNNKLSSDLFEQCNQYLMLYRFTCPWSLFIEGKWQIANIFTNQLHPFVDSSKCTNRKTREWDWISELLSVFFLQL